jgi:hypothetical protein
MGGIYAAEVAKALRELPRAIQRASDLLRSDLKIGDNRSVQMNTFAAQTSASISICAHGIASFVINYLDIHPSVSIHLNTMLTDELEHTWSVIKRDVPETEFTMAAAYTGIKKHTLRTFASLDNAILTGFQHHLSPTGQPILRKSINYARFVNLFASESVEDSDSDVSKDHVIRIRHTQTVRRRSTTLLSNAVHSGFVASVRKFVVPTNLPTIIEDLEEEEESRIACMVVTT